MLISQEFILKGTIPISKYTVFEPEIIEQSIFKFSILFILKLFTSYIYEPFEERKLLYFLAEKFKEKSKKKKHEECWKRTIYQ